MSKSKLVEAIAESTNLSKTESEKALKAITSSITASLQKGDKVTLSGFGSFQIIRSNSRTGRNPRTGQPIKIAARNFPKFKPGKILKNSVT